MHVRAVNVPEPLASALRAAELDALVRRERIDTRAARDAFCRQSLASAVLDADRVDRAFNDWVLR